MDDILAKFYVEVRKTDGEYYKKSSFAAVRFALQRKLKEICGIDFDIINDADFFRSNEIFKAQCVLLKKKGLCQVNHHPPITDEDIQKLFGSDILSVTSPKSLQRKVFFDIVYYFCRRGRENLRNLTKFDFSVEKNENGVECIIKQRDELTKNHQAKDRNEENGVIMATGGKECPVASFKLYVSKLNPKLDAFFQRPRPSQKCTAIDICWYENMVLGDRYLAEMMKNISKDAKLSK